MGNDPPQGLPCARGRSVRLDNRWCHVAVAGTEAPSMHSRALTALACSHIVRAFLSEVNL